MFSQKNKKEIEYKKTRSAVKREGNVKILENAYRIFYGLLVLMFFLTLVYSLFYAPFLAVEKIEIVGLESLDRGNVMNVAERSSDGRYFGIIPKRNLITFPVEGVKRDLAENFKRIRKIDVIKRFPNEVEIKIEERKSMLLWCQIQDRCLIVDENGVAYSRVALDSKEAIENNLVKIISGEENRDVSEGEKLLSAERVSYFLEVKKILSGDSGLEMESDILMNSRMAEDVMLKSKEGWKIYVNIEIPIRETSDVLKIFIKKEMPDIEERKKLDYVDLRIKNRIYHALIEEEENKEEQDATPEEKQE